MDGDQQTDEGVSNIEETSASVQPEEDDFPDLINESSEVLPVNTPQTPPGGSSLSERRTAPPPISPLARLAVQEPDGEKALGMSESPTRTRHTSGNPPGVRGVIIEGRRDASPIRSISPFRSPAGSPRMPGDRPFILPAAGATGTRVSTSTSDNSIHSGGARPKSAPKKNDTGASSSSESRRRNSSASVGTQRRVRRPRLSEMMPEDPCSREVVEQSEEVMQNYMFERYTRDVQHEGREAVPTSPTLLENFTRRPQTNVSALGRRLATIGDEIDAKYQAEFQMMTKSLNIKQGAFEEAYDAFKGVAMKLFRSGLSMGRIVALLQFGYHLALDVLRQGIGDFMAEIVSWLVRFISTERIFNVISRTTQSIAEWIAGQGGWQGAIEGMTRSILTESVPAVMGFIAASTVLAAAVFFYHRRWL